VVRTEAQPLVAITNQGEYKIPFATSYGFVNINVKKYIYDIMILQARENTCDLLS
jgi:hypothetical protein